MGAKQQGADATKGRWLTIPRTLSFVMNGHDILMMKRSPHKRVFPNQYNGLGGHLERDEDPLTGAIREIKEESGLDVHSSRLRSIHNIDAGQNTGIILFVFTAISESRDVIQDVSEGTLEWISRNDILSVDLVEDLPLLIPRILDMSDDAPPQFVHVSYDKSNTIRMLFREF